MCETPKKKSGSHISKDSHQNYVPCNFRLTFKVAKVAHVFHNTLVSAVCIWTSFTDGRAVGWAGRWITTLWVTATRRSCLYLHLHWEHCGYHCEWILFPWYFIGYFILVLELVKNWQVRRLINICRNKTCKLIAQYFTSFFFFFFCPEGWILTLTSHTKPI